MHDGITFERLGIPTAVLITQPFLPTARAIAELDGLPDYSCVVVEHPITSLSEQQLADRARVAAGQVETVLLGNTAGQAAESLQTSQIALEDVQQLLEPIQDGMRTDGADLVVATATDDLVSVRLAFSDETCTDCIMPTETLHSTIATMLARHYGRPVSLSLQDPRRES